MIKYLSLALLAAALASPAIAEPLNPASQAPKHLQASEHAELKACATGLGCDAARQLAQNQSASSTFAQAYDYQAAYESACAGHPEQGHCQHSAHRATASTDGYSYPPLGPENRALKRGA